MQVQVQEAVRRNEAADRPKLALWRTSAEAVAHRAAGSGPAIARRTRGLEHVSGRRTLARCHDSHRAQEDDRDSYGSDRALRDELPPLLGVHPRQEYLSGLRESVVRTPKQRVPNHLQNQELRTPRHEQGQVLLGSLWQLPLR